MEPKQVSAATVRTSKKRAKRQLKKQQEREAREREEAERARAASAAEGTGLGGTGYGSEPSRQPTEPELANPPSHGQTYGNPAVPSSNVGGGRGRGHPGTVYQPSYAAAHQQTAGARVDDLQPTNLAPVNRPPDRETRQHAAADRGPVFLAHMTPSPDSNIQDLEDSYVQNARQNLDMGSLSLTAKFPVRPAYGTNGDPVTLRTNYFALHVNRDLAVYRYQLEVRPSNGNAPGPKLKSRVVKLLLEQHFQPQIGKIATDYKATLLCREPLTGVTANSVFDVRYRGEEETGIDSNARTYSILVQQAGMVTLSRLLDYLAPTAASSSLHEKEEIIQALNIIVGHHPKSEPNVLTLGANRHFVHKGQNPKPETQDLGGCLQAIRGYFVSVRPAIGRLLANVQVQYATCYHPGNLLDLLWNLYEYDTRKDLNVFLNGLRVCTKHLPRKNGAFPVKTLRGIALPGDGRNKANPPRIQGESLPSEVEFHVADVGYISVADYFAQKYRMTVDPQCPVVLYGSRNDPCYLPADVCEVLPGQTANTKLDERQTKAMHNFAVRRPAENARSIANKGLGVIGSSPPNPMLTNMAIDISTTMTAVPGRVLPAPKVRYGTTDVTPSNGGWNLINVKGMTSGRALRDYAFLIIQRGNAPADNLDQRLAQLVSNLKKYNFNPRDKSADRAIYRQLSRNVNVSSMVQEAFTTANNFIPKPRVIFVVLPFYDSNLYNQIKQKGDILFGIHTICMLENSLCGAKKPGSYIGNIIPKVNLKLGGTNQVVNDHGMNIITQSRTMVVGIDVTHPSPGSSDQAPSIAGMVASIDQQMGQFPAVIRLQTERRKEMVDCLQEMLASRLRLWQRHNNNTLPQNILIYRDGVSEGQYKTVLDEELPPLREACKKFYGVGETESGIPRMSIVIVGKRHQTRFYPTSDQEGDQNGNPKPGTIVERSITEARNWDFFLQPHFALNGTARPAHYFVVLDEIFGHYHKDYTAATNALQDLTHKMCYLWSRATKAVSICPPAYYADLVCERARRYLARYYTDGPGPTALGEASGQPTMQQLMDVHPNLVDTMFYI